MRAFQGFHLDSRKIHETEQSEPVVRSSLFVLWVASRAIAADNLVTSGCAGRIACSAATIFDLWVGRLETYGR